MNRLADQLPLVAGLAAWMLISVGCTQRTIHITTDPAGALVHLNDREVGATPLTVPFTFYGTYDVRVEHSRWLTPDDAAAALDVDRQQIRQWVEQGWLIEQTRGDQVVVLVRYESLHTQADAAAPWWEYPGPDLVAEAVPGTESRFDWHFELKPLRPRLDEQALLDRAGALRQQMIDGDE